MEKILGAEQKKFSMIFFGVETEEGEELMPLYFPLKTTRLLQLSCQYAIPT